jgi:uncharacterized protein (DUF488 family)
MMEILRDVNVEALVDVRRNAVSRKRGFSGPALRSTVEEEGILYFHIPGLGVSSEDRRGIRTREDHRGLLARYRLALPYKMDQLQVLEDICARYPTALLCYEREPGLCHRSVLTQTLAGRGFDVIEL